MDVGQPISVAMTKWRDHPHWAYDGIYLGADEHGEWLGFPTGTHYERPGLAVDIASPNAVLVPASGAAALASFRGPRAKAAVYVDIATPPTWDPAGAQPVLRGGMAPYDGSAARWLLQLA